MHGNTLYTCADGVTMPLVRQLMLHISWTMCPAATDTAMHPKSHLGLGQAADQLSQSSALLNVPRVQICIAELAQARALQVGLLQTKGGAVASYHAQAGPDPIHLPQWP